MSEAQPLMNEPAARTTTGEILDQGAKPPEPNTNTTPPIETKPPEPKLETKPAEAAKPEGAPEKYEDFKVPEGMKLEGETLTSATKLFKDLNLTQAGAQSLVDFHSVQLKAAAEAPLAEYDRIRTEWKTKADADPDIGPKAAQIKETVSRALDTIGDKALVDDFKHAMNLTGVGDHPAFIKVLNKLASQVIEGRPAQGAGPSAASQVAPGSKPPSIANAMYPNL